MHFCVKKNKTCINTGNIQGIPTKYVKPLTKAFAFGHIYKKYAHRTFQVYDKIHKYKQKAVAKNNNRSNSTD